MVQVTRRTGLTGSALVDLLAGLADGDAVQAGHSFSDRMSQWLRWTDAIALSAALDGEASTKATATAGQTVRHAARGSAAAAVSPAAADAPPAVPEETEFRRVRQSLQKAIAADLAFLADQVRQPLRLTAVRIEADDDALASQQPPASAASIDFAPFRLRYQTRQQGMEAGIGPLRLRARKRLEGRSPALARLAAVDAVMEQALGPQERSLLGTLPGLLEGRFRRLRDAASGTEDAPPWVERFCRDMRDVLLAGLDIRLQPVRGLLEALHDR